VIDAFDPTTWAFEGSIDVNPAIAQIDIPPTRFSRFSPKNAIVLEVLLKEQEGQIVAELRAKPIVAVGKRLGLAGFAWPRRRYDPISASLTFTGCLAMSGICYATADETDKSG
jgi:hypothetical protein